MIVGVDVSSYRIDLAWVQDGRPCRWHQELPKKAHLIDRLRSIRVEWPRTRPFDLSQIGHVNPPAFAERLKTAHDVTDVAIEYPFGRGNAVAALMATVGVITRQAPPWARVAWPSSGELRAAIGAKNTKAEAHAFVHAAVCPIENDMGNCPIGDWDEHELDALVACLGWSKILEAQEAA